MTVNSAYAPPTRVLTDIQGNLSDMLDEITRTGSEVVIAKHGKPVAVLLAYKEYESLIETDILSDDETMAAIAESETDFTAGNFSLINQI